MSPIQGEGMITQENVETVLKKEEFNNLVVSELNILFRTKKKIENKEVPNILLCEGLLDKPNMTQKDKENMQKAINFLKENKMFAKKNIEKLDKINYFPDAIEIGDIKRAREDLNVEENGKTIFNYNGISYFEFSEVKKINNLLEHQSMKIPTKDDYEKSLQALPGDFSLRNKYIGGNILAFLIDMPTVDWYRNLRINKSNQFSNRWTSSSINDHEARSYRFDPRKGKIRWNRTKNNRIPIRAIYK